MRKANWADLARASQVAPSGIHCEGEDAKGDIDDDGVDVRRQESGLQPSSGRVHTHGDGNQESCLHTQPDCSGLGSYAQSCCAFTSSEFSPGVNLKGQARAKAQRSTPRAKPKNEGSSKHMRWDGDGAKKSLAEFQSSLNTESMVGFVLILWQCCYPLQQ